MDEKLRHGFTVGSLEVRPGQNTITGPNGTVRVEPKSMAVLARLAVARSETVSRDELLSAGWPGRCVTDDVLSRCIAQLRKAFGDDARSPRYLETIPKRGYRLMQPVSINGAQATAVRADDGHPRLIVLPFLNNSGNPDDAYIADGFTELLIARLAALRSVRVISRTTAMTFAGSGDSVPEIAARIGVDWVVEGSVLASADNIQVVAQLIEARGDDHVWADSFFRPITDLLVLQNDIASKVAAQIGQEIGLDRHVIGAGTGSLSADGLRLFLRGRQLVSRRSPGSIRKAMACFEKLTDLEPGFADGWACLAEALKLLMHYGVEPPEKNLATAFALVNRALEIDPECAVALSARGSLRLLFERDIERGTVDLKHALHSQPDYIFSLLSLANAETIRGNFDEARRWLEQALEVDPLDVGLNMNLGDHLILHRRYGQAAAQLRRTLELDDAHVPSRLRLAWALALGGDQAAAINELETVERAIGESSAWLEYAAIVAGAVGDTDRAGMHFRRLQQVANDCTFVSPWALARAAASAGDNAQAIGYLEKAKQDGSSSLAFLVVTPVFDQLRESTSGKALLVSLGLKPIGLRGKPGTSKSP